LVIKKERILATAVDSKDAFSLNHLIRFIYSNHQRAFFIDTYTEGDFMRKNKKKQNNLQEFRMIHGFTQEELADKVSVSIQTIQSIENGRYKPSDSLAFNIARSLNREVGDIFS
jgi:putative transcriptional regulator